MHLLLVDTAGIQPYIFGSNRLREQVGASHLVKQATGDWALEAVTCAFPDAHNVDLAQPGGVDPDRHIGEGGVEAEVLYAAGGNLMLLASDETKLNKFVRGLSRRVLLEAPGLPVVTARVAVNWATDAMKEKVDEVFRALFVAKRTMPPSAELLGLSVTRAGQSTGLPAIERTPTNQGDADSSFAASAPTLAKHAVFNEASQYLADKIPVEEYGFVYPRDLDDLGRSEGEMSYVAVVHADGNGMGRRIREVGADLFDEQHNDYNADLSTSERNRRYVEALRTFSHKLEAAAVQAQKDVFQGLAERVEEGALVFATGEGEQQREVLRIVLKKEKGTGKWYLPVRPLVFGGDDLTFVSDGRLGLAMALHYLRRFEHYTEYGVQTKDGEPLAPIGKLTASAGVAVVKTHYPFSRAYDLAEALAGAAKKLRKHAREQHENWEASCLDWHFAESGLSGPLDLIRRREYRARKKAGEPARLHLHLRPVALGKRPPDSVEGSTSQQQSSEAQRWEVVKEAVEAFREDEWAGRRNKIKRLREALRGGQEEVERFTAAIGDLPKLDGLASVGGAGEHTKKGWADSLRCAYFDAVELLDFYFPMENLYPDAAKQTDSDDA